MQSVRNERKVLFILCCWGCWYVLMLTLLSQDCAEPFLRRVLHFFKQEIFSLLCAHGRSRLWTPYSCIMAHLRNKILHVCLLFGLFSLLRDLQKCFLPGVNETLHLLTVTNNSADILQVCNSIDNIVSG